MIYPVGVLFIFNLKTLNHSKFYDAIKISNKVGWAECQFPFPNPIQEIKLLSFPSSYSFILFILWT